jgi:hypothetical protein
MSARCRRAIVIAVAGIYLLGLGFLAGIMVDRMRFDARRSATLRELEEAEQRVRARLMGVEMGIANRTRGGALALAAD